MVFVIIPNFNGQDFLKDCLNSLNNSDSSITEENIIIVDNASSDNSLNILKIFFPKVIVLKQKTNLGFAGGVNVGINYAINHNAEFVVLLNNDTVVAKNWGMNLLKSIRTEQKIGATASKIISFSPPHTIDSTGDFYSTWGLPFPRGRGNQNINKYDELDPLIFGSSGGASVYRVKMLKEIGLFDEDFFAYYEDVDLSFRARLAGWDITYEPKAVVYHKIGATSSKISGFTTYHTFKNLPWLIVKDLPSEKYIRVIPRFLLAYFILMTSAIIKGKGWYALKGFLVSMYYMSKKIGQRKEIFDGTHQSNNVSKYIYDGLPRSYKGLYSIFHPFRKKRRND